MNRRREVSLLNDVFDRAASRERAHLVTLLGEPGIGKTRVVTEFLAGLPDGTQVCPAARARSKRMWSSGRSPRWSIVSWGRTRRALRGRRGPARDAVTEWVDPDEVEGAVRRLGLAMGLHEDGGADTRYQVAEVRQGVLACSPGSRESGPVVLVFEDLHQADPLLLDLIEQLVKEARKVPLLVVCVARWEFLEDRPNWAGGSPTR